MFSLSFSCWYDYFFKRSLKSNYKPLKYVFRKHSIFITKFVVKKIVKYVFNFSGLENKFLLFRKKIKNNSQTNY